MRPSRGEVWVVQLDPVRGHEQAGRRPALVLSVDALNHGPAGIVVAIPITSKSKAVRLHVEIDPPEGGLKTRSWIKIEDIRSLSIERFDKRWGRVSPQTMRLIEQRIASMLGI